MNKIRRAKASRSLASLSSAEQARINQGEGEKRFKFPIYSLTPFTMLDFPGRTACIVWLSGCNMRCGYCHNPELVKGHGQGTVDEIMAFLHQRIGRLEGVVFSGGEASIWPGLPGMMRLVKSLGYAVKLDTNGTQPLVLQRLLADELIDYVALDYKAPPDKFRAVSGTRKFESLSQSLDLLCAQNKVAYEVRTTVHTDLMNEEDIIRIIRDLEGRGYDRTYFVQNFRSDNHRATLGFLKHQPRILDIGSLPSPHNFSLAFRNFTNSSS